MSLSPLSVVAIPYKCTLDADLCLTYTPIRAIMRHELFSIKGENFMARVTRRCGVYAIINQVSAHRYIGSSCSINRRWAEHRYDLRHGKHKSEYLQNAWNKYGETSFVFTILEIVESPELLQEREQHYMDFFQPEYNIYPYAFSSRGAKHSEETKSRISQKNRGHLVSEEQRELLRQVNLGKKMTPEARENHRRAMNRPEMIEANRQRALGRKDSPETRAKKSASSLIAQNRPEQLELNRQKQLGKKMPPESVKRGSEKRKGQKRTPEQIARLRASRTPESFKVAWEKRRANKQENATVKIQRAPRTRRAPISANDESKERKPRGFAAMSPEKHRHISHLGGLTAQREGKARHFTSENAQEAGRKGGLISRYPSKGGN